MSKIVQRSWRDELADELERNREDEGSNNKLQWQIEKVEFFLIRGGSNLWP